MRASQRLQDSWVLRGLAGATLVPCPRLTDPAAQIDLSKTYSSWAGKLGRLGPNPCFQEHHFALIWDCFPIPRHLLPHPTLGKTWCQSSTPEFKAGATSLAEGWGGVHFQAFLEDFAQGYL